MKQVVQCLHYHIMINVECFALYKGDSLIVSQTNIFLSFYKINQLSQPLSRLREREIITFHRLIFSVILGKLTIADLRHIRCALLNFKSTKNGALLIFNDNLVMPQKV
jgi:hypothetical protein